MLDFSKGWQIYLKPKHQKSSGKIKICQSFFDDKKYRTSQIKTIFE